MECRGMAPSLSKRSICPTGLIVDRHINRTGTTFRRSPRSTSLCPAALGRSKGNGIRRCPPVARTPPNGTGRAFGSSLCGTCWKEPVPAKVAFADRVVHVVREEPGILQRDARVGVFLALEEFRAVAVGNADLPELPAAADRRPTELAQVSDWPGSTAIVSFRELAEYAVGKRVQGVRARADVRDREVPVVVAADPELIVLGVGLPVDRPAARASRAGRVARRCIGGDALDRPAGWASTRRASADRSGRAGP